MPFLEDARALCPTLSEDDPLRITLEYLDRNAVGSAEAVPIDNVLDELERHGHGMSKSQFQQTILGQTRRGTIFIGVAHGKGIFLIATRDDAIATKNFYASRIRSERTHLENLETLVTDEGWEPI